MLVPDPCNPLDVKFMFVTLMHCLREVLMRHLDEEVADLQGENLRKYWTLEEVERIAI